MRLPTSSLAPGVAAWLLAAVSARGDFALPFTGLQNGEQVLNYYNGGTGNLGTGPGPNFGISFTPMAMAVNLAGSPPVRAMILTDGNPDDKGKAGSATMDVAPGFANFLGVDYHAIDVGEPPTVTIYSGSSGTGSILAQLTLPINSSFEFLDIPFSGVAHSVVFDGFQQQEAYHLLTLSIVPEPSALGLLLTGFTGLAAATRVRRRLARPHVFRWSPFRFPHAKRIEN